VPIFKNYPETSLTNYQSTLPNIAEEQKSLFEGYYGPPACSSDKSSNLENGRKWYDDGDDDHYDVLNCFNAVK
jgi:hypothetical protein